MRRIADYGLVEIADLDFHAAVGVGDRSEIAGVAIAADPDSRAFGERVTFNAVEPFIELGRVATHVGMRGFGHFHVAALEQERLTIIGAGKLEFLFLGHGIVLWCSIEARRMPSQCNAIEGLLGDACRWR